MAKKYKTVLLDHSTKNFLGKRILKVNRKTIEGFDNWEEIELVLSNKTRIVFSGVIKEVNKKVLK